MRTGLLDRPRARLAFEATYLMYKGLFEAGPVDGLAALVPTGSTTIDVGANIGFFSLRFARWVGPSGKVLAIEPEPRNVASLSRRVQRAGVGDIVQRIAAAAADKPGELLLSVTPGHPGDHHVSDSGMAVPAVTLDELVADDVRRVSLIKIDVQGAEAMVLAGAQRVIERNRPAIFVEIDAFSLARSGSSPESLVEVLTNLGYCPRHLTSRGVGPRRDCSELLADVATGYVDALFVYA